MGDKTIREMKTAMQELFSQLEIEHPNLFNTNTLEGRKFINDYYKFFEMEKQQIKDGYHKGCSDQLSIPNRGYKPEQYYNETYNI
jgi:hypothetical protein